MIEGLERALALRLGQRAELQLYSFLIAIHACTLGTDEIPKSVLKGEFPMKLIEGFDSNYRYILVAARRARQLQSGAPPVVDTTSRKPCRIAQDEIRAGKVKWEIPETRPAAEPAGETLDKALGQE